MLRLFIEVQQRITVMEHTPLRGFCDFFFETGTEGGYWVFQDETFIVPNTWQFRCEQCGLLWNKQSQPNGPFNFRGPSADNTQCTPNKHDFIIYPETISLFDGMHILKDGDRLAVYDPNNSGAPVWSGIISLIPYRVFTERAFGFWIHADQKGVGREMWATWFFKKYPAQLIPAEANAAP